MTEYNKTLKEVFKENGIKYNDFIKKTNISRARLFTYLQKTKKEDFKDYEVALLCSLLPITPEFFGKENSIYEFKKTNNNSVISYYNLLKQKEIKNYEEYLNLYFEKIIAEVNKAKESIIVLDYVGNNYWVPLKISSSGGDFENYQINYKKYLKSISNFIKRKEKEDASSLSSPAYTRILQCPINKYKNGIKHKNKIDEVLDYSYSDMFTQFESLYKKYKDYFKLCYVKNAFRPYSVMIIDNKTVVTEYVRYNKNLEPVPDILFIDKKLSDSPFDTANILIETYMKSINSVINNEKNIITRLGAKSRLISIKKYYEKKVNSMNMKLKKITVNINNDEMKNIEIIELKYRKKKKYLENRLKQTIEKLENF